MQNTTMVQMCIFGISSYSHNPNWMAILKMEISQPTKLEICGILDICYLSIITTKHEYIDQTIHFPFMIDKL